MGASTASFSSAMVILLDFKNPHRLSSRAVYPATPRRDPDLYSYSCSCGMRNILYVSWNGATNVETWRFNGGDLASSRFEKIAHARKEGFETGVQAVRFARFTCVQDWADDGTLLGRSKTMRPVVPPKTWSRGCSEFRCQESNKWLGTSDACVEDDFQRVDHDDHE